MITFNLSCICDLAEFYGIALLLLAVLLKRYGCGGMTTVLFSNFIFLEFWI
jgi:hypothetical protein